MRDWGVKGSVVEGSCCVVLCSNRNCCVLEVYYGIMTIPQRRRVRQSRGLCGVVWCCVVLCCVVCCDVM